MENNKTIITECEATKLFNNFKKFYHAFIKINNIKIEKNIILEFLYQLLSLECDFYTYNHFRIFPFITKLQLREKYKENEMEIIKIYETYFKEHIGHRFIAFLKRYDALDFYKDNLNKQMNETLLGRILFAEPQYYIDSFSWEETKQGYDYWDDLQDIWMEIIYNESNNTQVTQEFFEQIKKIIDEYL